MCLLLESSMHSRGEGARGVPHAMRVARRGGCVWLMLGPALQLSGLAVVVVVVVRELLCRQSGL